MDAGSDRVEYGGGSGGTLEPDETGAESRGLGEPLGGAELVCQDIETHGEKSKKSLDRLCTKGEGTCACGGGERVETRLR